MYKTLAIFLVAIILLTSLPSCKGVHTCVFDNKAIEDRLIKNEASCSSGTEYYYSCSCGNVGVGTFYYGEEKHSYSKIADDKYLVGKANQNGKTKFYESCTLCGKKGDDTFIYTGYYGNYKNRSVLIFGDSYSTFYKHIPDDYSPWYPRLDVQNVAQMWYSKFIALTDSTLVGNYSYSGSTICHTGYYGEDCSSSTSFIYRYRKLKSEGAFEGLKVNTVFVFGGTNDSWADAHLGDIKYENWSEDDLYKVLPAISYFANMLKTDFPDADVIFIINTDIKREIQDGIAEVAEHYGARAIRLIDIHKEEGHPNVEGMRDICNQLADVLR